MENIIKKLKGISNIFIYGTEEILNTTCIFLSKFGVECKMLVVSQENVTDDEIIEKLSSEMENMDTLLVATKMEHQENIMIKLNNFKIKEIIFVTSEVYNLLRLEYVKKCYEESGKPLIRLSDLSKKENLPETSGEVKVFMVKSDKDKVLNKKIDLPNWVIPIQAGRACTDVEIAEITDDKGENISYRNAKYCELTAMYWIWKHADYKYIGLCHYRRHFVIDETDVNYLLSSDIDVVLPIPTVCNGSVKEYYYRNHVASHFEDMMKLLKDKYFEYYKTAEDVFNKEYYYACNMLIARKDVFDEYCSWLFDILFELEEICEPQTDKYHGRYMGFLAERLTSLYFMHNKDRLKIAHVDKNFI